MEELVESSFSQWPIRCLRCNEEIPKRTTFYQWKTKPPTGAYCIICAKALISEGKANARTI